MPSDYESIRAHNIKEYGEGTRHLAFLGRLYTDRAHFIFELLQNAEDAGTTKILFELFEDRLEVKHDGRPFDESDVRGVCGVGEGTKAGDLTQIGRFGIGFKSVYAYTSAPEVHSGEEHFRIDDYVRPHKVADKKPNKLWTTLFVFTFNAQDIEPQTARDEIVERLRKLSVRTLLFLRNIEEVEYKLPDKTGGVYLREVIPHDQARQVTVIGQKNGQSEDERWIVFERPLSVPDSVDMVRVEIGFKLESNSKDQTESVVRVKESPLVVYFPTEKLTRFGFLIQGPYRTTPSRDNIPKDDEWNTKFVKETAILLVGALQSMKKMGLLSVALFNALPIRMDDFTEDGMFYPIVEAVRNALLNQELLPTDDGSFVSAKNAKLARGVELRKLLGDQQREALFPSQSKFEWLSDEITKDKTLDLHSYLMTDLGVEEITADSFARKITSDFLRQQSDEWIVAFYQFLNGQEALWKKPFGHLRNKSFIRLHDGSHVSPFKQDESPNVYLPPQEDTVFHIVKREICEDKKAMVFLKKLGLTKPDVVAEVIEHIIPKYGQDHSRISEDEHEKDMKKILQAYSTDSQEKKKGLADKLKSTAFICAKNNELQKTEYKKPDEIYFQNEELLLYLDGNKDAWFVSSEYGSPFHAMFKALDVVDKVRIICQSKNYSLENVKLNSETYPYVYRRGLKGFDPNIQVAGLKHAVMNPSEERSKFIWNEIAMKYSHCIKGKVLRCSRQDFSPNASTHEENKMTSNFGNLLMNNRWLLNQQGDFHKPSELKLDDLPEAFERDEKLASQLDMNDVVAKLAEEAGISTDILQFAKDNPERIKQLLEEDAANKSNSEFPERKPKDAKRRKRKVQEGLSEAPKKKTETKEGTVNTSKIEIDARSYLKNMYTNSDGVLFCQLCHVPMPFKKRNGEYYMESVEITGHYLQEVEQLYLALCPNCSAKYKYFIKKDNEAQKQIIAEICQTESVSISLSLGESKATLRFVETHLTDLKAILETLGADHD